ncbi:MAG: hypothetical protein K6T30_00190 [Alicyclobacillus sp.]|nr:hypothetical protein [Alicyclobacillus sp.]
MAVLAGVLQILLFFVFWRLLHWVSSKARGRGEPSLWSDVAVNVAIALVLLIAVDNLRSAWWLMALIGAVVGVATGQLVARTQARRPELPKPAQRRPEDSGDTPVPDGDKPLEKSS